MELHVAKCIMTQANHILGLATRYRLMRRKEPRIKILLGRNQYRDISGRAESVTLRCVTQERQTLQPCNQHTHDLHNITLCPAPHTAVVPALRSSYLVTSMALFGWSRFPNYRDSKATDTPTNGQNVPPGPPPQKKNCVLMDAVHSGT